MFQQSSSGNSQNKGSKVKRVLLIALLLAVAVWLLSHIYKNEYAGGDPINVDQREDVDFGRKGKAGAENVIIINGQISDSDEIPETNEAGDQAEALDQHTEERNGQKGQLTEERNEQEESQEFISNTGQTEAQEEQLGNKDENDDSSTNGRDVAIGNETSNDKEDVLHLPNQRDSDNSQDQNEGENVEDNSLQQDEIVVLYGAKNDIGEAITSDEERIDNSLQQNELVTLDGAKNDTGEAMTSDEERILSSKNELEGGEKTDEVEKEAINSHAGVELETEINSENSFEVENEATDSHGVVKSETEGGSENSLEDTTANQSSDDASQSLPKEENGEVSIDNGSSEKNTLDSQGDTSTDSETTENHIMETENSDTRNEDEATNLPNSTEEKVSIVPIDSEVPKREAVALQDNSTLKADATDDNSLVDKTNTESDDKLTVTSVADDTKNVELPVIDKALERDAVDSHGDNASYAGRSDIEEEKMDSKSNKDALEMKRDGTSESQNAGNNFIVETSSGTSSGR